MTARTKRKSYDYVFVGSGVACATAAQVLLDADPAKSVLVLEAGPTFQLADRRKWWDYIVTGRRPYQAYQDRDVDNVSEGTEEWVFPESRLMVRGGSTVHWGGWSLRFKEEDFRLRTNTGRGGDWPFDLNELLPSYKMAEHLLGVSGDDAQEDYRDDPYPLPAYPYTAADGLMIEAFEKQKMRYAPMPVARFRRCMTTGTCKYCPVNARFSATFVLDRLAETYGEKFELATEAPVSRLLMSKRNRACGVEYISYPEGETHRVEGDTIVLGGGAIETPKLLQRSRSPFWPHGVGNDYDLVGRYLISHPFLYARVGLPENQNRWQQELDFPTLMSRHYDAPEDQDKGKLFLFKSRSRPRTGLAKMMREGRRREDIDRAVRGPMEFELQGFMEEFSNFHNRVENGPGVNHVGLPQTRVGFSRNPDFEKRKEARLAQMRTIVEGIPGSTFLKADIRSQRGDHAASTCRMSTQPDNGVVDANLKVHDVDNLYVCSNAVFPSGAAVNPTLTLTALALRLAEHLGSR